ncbi:SNF2 family N-terminal domain/Zinc finger, C3HC4 type (RING finger)/Ring finger domain/RING-type zinc-finger/Prokaryotic RING finger family 4/Helicase conserved C-terminal domain containing protein, putative [Leishmania lindenbergi]|uniref:RanBP-type and C3HC4-type zinc finger-containing protein 1 n=1 Tax=Leishmania lindenbergi TaxID=651832 RepID=A0AAW3AA02_9TRYP
MDDVDSFLASLDQFSSPSIDAGIQRQQEHRSGTAAAPSASPALTIAPRSSQHQRRRRPRDEDTSASSQFEAPQQSPFSSSSDNAGRHRSDLHLSAASPSLHTRTVVSSHSPHTWRCVRCGAESASQMQRCTLCHRCCHRVEEHQPLLTLPETSLSSVLPVSSPATQPGSSSQVFSPAAPTDERGLHLGRGYTIHGSGIAHGGGAGHESLVVAGPGEVSCPRCTFLNSSSRSICEMCDGTLPSLPSHSPAALASFTTTAKDGGASLGKASPPAVMPKGTPFDFSAAATGPVPSTALADLGSGGQPLRERSSIYQTPHSPELAPSAVVATAQRVILQEAGREVLPLSPVALKSQGALSSSSSSSSFSSGDGDDDDEESGNEWSDEQEAEVRGADDHRELVRFLETLQSVKFDTLPCAAVPATMWTRAELRPFQLQALYWLLSREQPQLYRAHVAATDTDALIMKKGEMGSFESGADSCRDKEAGVTYITSSRGGGGAAEWGVHFKTESLCMTSPASGALVTASCPSSAGVATRTPDSGSEGDVSMTIGGQEMTRTVRGGVFADYMGLGKTRTLIALCEATRVPRIDRVTGSLVESAATLIVCPTSLLTQWVREIHRCVERPATAPLRILLYYGARPRRLSLFQVAQSYDYVLTTYQTLCHKQPPASRFEPTYASGGASPTMSADISGVDDAVVASSLPANVDDYDVDRRLQTEVDKLFMIRWARIILDEAHYIRNMRTHQSRACLKLSGVCRWVVTATPVQNSLNDLYPLLRFLAVPHFSSLAWWNNEIVRYYNLDPHHPRPVTALSILFGSILLRRTPDSIVNGKPILELPPKRMITHTVGLSREETCFYQSIHAKATAKLNELRDREAYAARTPLATFTTAFEMLVRCRQTCLHPYIVVAALRRCHRLSGSEARRGATASLDEIDRASATANRASSEVARRQREDEQTARAIDEFIQAVVLRRLRGVKAREFVQSLVEEIKDRKLESRECIICLDTVNRPAILPCAHVFCEECITHALQATRRCPLCKRNSRPSELLLVPVEILGPTAQQLQTSAGGGDDRVSAAEPAPEVPLNLDLTDMSNWGLQLSSKTQYLIDKIRSLPADDKVVVFSTFLTYLRCAQHWLQAAGVSCAVYTGSMTMKQKHSLLELFHDATQPASPRVLLATTSSCGVGLNLTCANHCFLMEPSWNPGTEEQALNRIHRIGQTKPVTITKLIADGTIEQNISQLCERKRALSGYCFSNGVAGAPAAGGGGGAGRLRTADLLELFAPEMSSESSDDDSDDDASEEDDEE